MNVLASSFFISAPLLSFFFYSFSSSVNRLMCLFFWGSKSWQRSRQHMKRWDTSQDIAYLWCFCNQMNSPEGTPPTLLPLRNKSPSLSLPLRHCPLQPALTNCLFLSNHSIHFVIMSHHVCRNNYLNINLYSVFFSIYFSTSLHCQFVLRGPY